MTSEDKIKAILDICWTSYINKVASNVLKPENEKMMQLQLSHLIQSAIPLFEFYPSESLKVLLEVPVEIDRTPSKRIIDIVIAHANEDRILYYPIELKCFRKYVHGRDGIGAGAGTNKMFSYWKDIENIEQYSLLSSYSFGTQLTLTDEDYFINGPHARGLVAIFSTNRKVSNITGQLIKTDSEVINLRGTYSMENWLTIGKYNFIRQSTIDFA